MADYDLPRAFARIEDTLIDSMMRNFKRHRAEETAEGYNWTQWQVEQLKAFEEYKAKNRKTFGSQFSSLNTRVAEMLRKTKSDAEYAQEQKILNAIQRGYKPKRTSAQSRAEFFKMNERKMNALVKSTTSDLTKAEHAVLRMSNDKYRKAIFDAQVYMNSGAATYAQAVDMAVKDMLSAGLNCVQYKNGARHTLSDYAEMAIRTANKRAYLRGEGEKAQEWGISTVIINRRHGACGRCADFVGMVFIDDVYAGGKKIDEGGKYPLLSDAMKAGLFHPRCKDSSSLYIEGISTPPGREVLPKKSQEELSEIERLEQKTSHGKRMQKMYSRLGKYALDPDNKTAYLNKAESWKKYTEFWQGKHEKALANAVESGIIKLKKGSSSEEIVWLPKGERISKKAFEDLRSYAEKYGVSLERFKKSDVDVDLIKDLLDGIKQVLDVFPELSGTDRKPLTLILSSSMKPSDFAETKKGISHIIYLNGNAFRNYNKLEKEYQLLVSEKWFVQGTNSTTIVKHELGHLYQSFHHISDETIVDIAIQSSGVHDKIDLFGFLQDNLSLYSGSYVDGSEIISEVFSDYFGNDNPSSFSKGFIERLLQMR